jgi:hypothetical protein
VIAEMSTDASGRKSKEIQILLHSKRKVVRVKRSHARLNSLIMDKLKESYMNKHYIVYNYQIIRRKGIFTLSCV